ECGQRRPPDALPDSCFSPPFQSSPDCRWCAIFPRQVLPTAAGNKDVKNALNGAAIMGAWTSRSRWRRQEWPDERPLPVSQMNPAHTSRLSQQSSVSEPSLSSFAKVVKGSERWSVGGREVDLEPGKQGLGGLLESFEIVPPAMAGELVLEVTP